MARTTQGVNKFCLKIGLLPVQRGGVGGANLFDTDDPAAERLPIVTRLALGKLDGIVGAPEKEVAPSDEHDDKPQGPLTAAQHKSFGYVCEILGVFKSYRELRGGDLEDVGSEFVKRSNAGEIEFSESTYLKLKRKPLTWRTLRRWRTERRPLRVGARRGASKLTSEQKRIIVSRINEHERESHIYEYFVAHFEDRKNRGYDLQGRKLVCVRTVGNFIHRFKKENSTYLQARENPIRFRSHRRFAIAQADAEIVRPNQQWQLDGSPCDVLLKDGSRWVIIVMIDVFTRRVKFLV